MRGPLRQTSVRRRADDLVPGRLDVARHVEVEIAIRIGIEERAAGAPAAGGDSGARGDLLEAAIAAIAEQHVGTPVGHVEIEAAVAIGIAGADAVAPGGRVHAGLRRHVGELPPAKIAIQRVAVRDALARRRELGRRDQVDVETSVAVVVDESDAVAADSRTWSFVGPPQ